MLNYELISRKYKTGLFNLHIKGVMTSVVSSLVSLIQPTMLQNNKQYAVHVREAVISLQQYMDKFPLAHKTVTELWDVHVGNSRSMVEKAFKDITGYRIKEYLVLRRLDYSKNYLMEGMPIKWVSSKTLYKSQSAYCTAFKRFFNTTPSDWLAAQQ